MTKKDEHKEPEVNAPQEEQVLKDQQESAKEDSQKNDPNAGLTTTQSIYGDGQPNPNESKQDEPKAEEKKAAKKQSEKTDAKSQKQDDAEEMVSIYVSSKNTTLDFVDGQHVVKGSVNGEEFKVPVDQQVEVKKSVAEALKPLIERQGSLSK